MKKIYFTNSNGLRLCGILSNSKDDVARPVMILCHGFTSNKDSKTYPTLEKLLNERNIATLRFDFCGHGESGGKFEDITISEAADDILRAIEYLKGLGYLKIGLLGCSFGGAASIVAASKSKDLSLLVLKSPVSNYLERELARSTKKELDEWKNKGYKDYFNSKGTKFKLNYSFFEDFAENDGYKAAEKITVPTLVVHGDVDTSVPVEQSAKLSEILSDCRLEIIKGANHHYSGPKHYQKHLDLIVNFIVENF